MHRPDIFAFKPIIPTISGGADSNVDIQFSIEAELDVEYMTNIDLMDHLLARSNYKCAINPTGALAGTPTLMNGIEPGWQPGWHPVMNSVPVATDLHPVDTNSAHFFAAPCGNDALGYQQKLSFRP